ncbi:MAG: ABC transporter ATP-binding protein [Chloroflexi bacterium]|nr:MAG: ABC transporter ATP-binding protein [Chloroflexota bacterium]
MEPIIKLTDITKSYEVGGEEFPVLHGISLDIVPGEFVSIVGESGNGKSTLLNMITGIDHPTAGEVVVNGRLLNNMSENQLAEWRGSDLGIVFQFFQLLPALSLLQNVMLPMDLLKNLSRRQRRERALHLLEMVGLADQAKKLPNTVSGGQQQRAAIARALANDPPLIVADEPTGNLDSRTSADLFTLFRQLVSQGKTLIMVTHNEPLARQAQRLLEIRDGIIVRDELSQTDDLRATINHNPNSLTSHHSPLTTSQS